MSYQCKSVFNRLSRSGRYALKSAAVAEALTDFIQKDTAQYPWRFPLYAGYMILIAAPLPLIGIGALLAAATMVWAKLEMGPMAKRLNHHIKESFNGESLPERYRDFIKHTSGTEETCAIKPFSLGLNTARQGAKDGYQAGKHAFNALKRYIT